MLDLADAERPTPTGDLARSRLLLSIATSVESGTTSVGRVIKELARGLSAPSRRLGCRERTSSDGRGATRSAAVMGVLFLS
jgi:hypothetical protein